MNQTNALRTEQAPLGRPTGTSRTQVAPIARPTGVSRSQHHEPINPTAHEQMHLPSPSSIFLLYEPIYVATPVVQTRIHLHAYIYVQSFGRDALKQLLNRLCTPFEDPSGHVSHAQASALSILHAHRS